MLTKETLDIVEISEHDNIASLVFQMEGGSVVVRYPVLARSIAVKLAELEKQFPSVMLRMRCTRDSGAPYGMQIEVGFPQAMRLSKRMLLRRDITSILRDNLGVSNARQEAGTTLWVFDFDLGKAG